MQKEKRRKGETVFKPNESIEQKVVDFIARQCNGLGCASIPMKALALHLKIFTQLIALRRTHREKNVFVGFRFMEEQKKIMFTLSEMQVLRVLRAHRRAKMKLQHRKMQKRIWAMKMPRVAWIMKNENIRSAWSPLRCNYLEITNRWLPFFIPLHSARAPSFETCIRFFQI